MGTVKQHADAASLARSDLNMAYAIIALCENSMFRTNAGRALEAAVIKACKAQTGKMLREFDRNMAALNPADADEANARQ